MFLILIEYKVTKNNRHNKVFEDFFHIVIAHAQKKHKKIGKTFVRFKNNV